MHNRCQMVINSASFVFNTFHLPLHLQTFLQYLTSMMKLFKLPLFYILSFLISFPLFSLAQPQGQGQGQGGSRPSIGILKGQVIDESTGKPIEYGTIAILSMRDSSLAGGTITEPSGNFKIEQIQAGKYMVRIQYMGYKTHMVNDVFFKPSAPEVNLGTIKLEPTASTIQGVEISEPQLCNSYST